MNTFGHDEYKFVSLKTAASFTYTPQMMKVVAKLIPALDYAKAPNITFGSQDLSHNTHPSKPSPKPSVPTPMIDTQKPPAPPVTLEPKPSIDSSGSHSIAGNSPVETIDSNASIPAVSLPAVDTNHTIPAVDIPTIDTSAPLVPTEVGETLIDTPVADPSAVSKPGHEYTYTELLNPSNLAGYMIDYFSKPTPSAVLPEAPQTQSEPSFFATSVLNPSYVANQITLAVSDYFDTPKEPSFFATSILNTSYVANELTLAVSDYFKPVTTETLPSLETTQPSVELNVAEPVAPEIADKQPSFFATSLFNPVNIADSLMSSASDAYHHLFDPKIVTPEEIQGLQTQITTEKSFLADLHTQISSLTSEIASTHNALDQNIKNALNAYMLLEDQNLDMHDLLEKHAPGSATDKLMEAFTPAWAKIEPEEVTMTFQEITSQSSAQDLNWVVKHLEKTEARLDEATQNAIKYANQTASKITSQEVTSFEQTQSILASQKEHLAELDIARQEASLAFKMHHSLYQEQTFYDFSKSGDYQSAKLALDQATEAYETAALEFATLNKAVDSVLTLQELHEVAQNAYHSCIEIQQNLNALQTETAALYKLQTSEQNTLANLSKHEKQLINLEKDFALQQQTQQAKDLSIVLPEKTMAESKFLELAPKSQAYKLQLEDVLTQPDFFSQKAALTMYDSAKHVNYFNTLSSASQNAMQAYGKMQWREAQLKYAETHYEAASDALELSKAEAASLMDPKFSNHGTFINAWVPQGVSATYVSDAAWHNKEVNSVEDAIFNRDKSQAVFDQELNFIAQSKNLNLDPHGITFQSVEAALTERMVLASEAEKAELTVLKHKVGEMSDNIATWNNLIESYKAYDTAHQLYVDSQKNLAQAQVLFENNEAVLQKLHADKPCVLPVEQSDAFYSVALPTLEKLATEDCFKPMHHLEVF